MCKPPDKTTPNHPTSYPSVHICILLYGHTTPNTSPISPVPTFLPIHLILAWSSHQRRLQDYCTHPKSLRTIYHTICTIFHDGY